MEKTPVYDLSQWAKTDRLLMEDFNADNARLEAALSALAARKADLTALNSAKSALQTEDARLDSVKLEYKPIKTYTFTVSNATTHTLELGSLPLWNYFFARLHVDVPEGALVQMFLGTSRNTPTPLGANESYQTAGMLSYNTDNDFLFFPMKHASAQVVAHRMDVYCEIHRGSSKYQNFNKIIFNPWKTQTNFSGTFTLTFTGIQ